MLVNCPWGELKIGQTARMGRTCTVDDLLIFAHTSGNLNPLHLPDLGGLAGEGQPTAPSMWAGSLFSALIGNVLPGPGSIYLSQNLRFHDRVHPGDSLVIDVTVRSKRPGRIVELDCSLRRNDGTLIADGVAEVLAPQDRVAVDGISLPEIAWRKRGKFDRLLASCRGIEPMPTAVVAPTDASSLGGAWEAAREALIEPILVGPATDIRRVAEEIGWDVSRVQIENVPNVHSAPARAVAMVHDGAARAVMKGNLHSDELLREVTKADGGLRSNRRISHVFALDVPGRKELLLITDAAINILPDLKTKADIVQNAIHLSHAIGIPEPRVGVLSAVETVNVAIPSTLDAAILSKMAERGQIRGGLVDGPLAMDNAVDLDAARIKGIGSRVAGHADVLVVPNLEAGNMLAKQLVFLSGADTAGIVVGARVPVMLTSRADDTHARLMSAALAVLYEHWQRTRVSSLCEGKSV